MQKKRKLFNKLISINSYPQWKVFVKRVLRIYFQKSADGNYLHNFKQSRTFLPLEYEYDNGFFIRLDNTKVYYNPGYRTRSFVPTSELHCNLCEQTDGYSRRFFYCRKHFFSKYTQREIFYFFK